MNKEPESLPLYAHVPDDLRDFLVAADEHAAAMYDLGFATGARHPSGPAHRNLVETAAAYVKAQKALSRAKSLSKGITDMSEEQAQAADVVAALLAATKHAAALIESLDRKNHIPGAMS